MLLAALYRWLLRKWQPNLTPQTMSVCAFWKRVVGSAGKRNEKGPSHVTVPGTYGRNEMDSHADYMAILLVISVSCGWIYSVEGRSDLSASKTKMTTSILALARIYTLRLLIFQNRRSSGPRLSQKNDFRQPHIFPVSCIFGIDFSKIHTDSVIILLLKLNMIRPMCFT